jgi:hypothetical protein
MAANGRAVVADGFKLQTMALLVASEELLLLRESELFEP